MPVPVLNSIVRRHAELAALLWTIYDRHLLNPDENEEMDEERVDRLLERLEAHLDALRIAGDVGREIARQRFEEYPEAGELFVIRMLEPGARALSVRQLDYAGVRRYLQHHLPQTPA